MFFTRRQLFPIASQEKIAWERLPENNLEELKLVKKKFRVVSMLLTVVLIMSAFVTPVAAGQESRKSLDEHRIIHAHLGQEVKMKLIAYDDIKNNEEIRAYIEKSDVVLGLMGYTENAFDHVGKVACTAADILLEFCYSEREAELARIAGFMHDIGNIVNRYGHA